MTYTYAHPTAALSHSALLRDVLLVFAIAVIASPLALIALGGA